MTKEELQKSHDKLQEEHAELQKSHDKLQEEHAELQKAHDKLQEEHAELQKANDAKAANDATTQARLEVLEKELVDKKEAIANLEADVSRLSKAQEGKPQAKIADLPVIKYNGKNYQVKLPAVILDGVKVTAEDLPGDDLIIKKLLERNSGMLAPV